MGPLLSSLASPIKETITDAAMAARRIARGEPQPGDSSRMTHAWLFTGPPGAGRSTAARAFAAALVCTGDQPGCGTCEACRTAMADTHADIVHIVPDGVVIPVAQVRQMVEAASRLPTTAPWRILIVQDADRLNDAGANALLKSIEEPPARTVFILCAPTTDPEDVQVTITSRCRQVYVPTPDHEVVAELLRTDPNLDLTPEQIQWAAMISGGHIGRARLLARNAKAREQRAAALMVPAKVYSAQDAYGFTHELVTRAKEEAESATQAIDEAEQEKLRDALGMGAKGRGAAKAIRGSAGQMKELEAKQKNRRSRMVLDVLDLSLVDVAGLYRDALLLATTQNSTQSAASADAGDSNSGAEVTPASMVRPIHPDKDRDAHELAQRLSAPQLLECIDAVNEARDLLRFNVDPERALEALMGRLRQICVTGYPS